VRASEVLGGVELECAARPGDGGGEEPGVARAKAFERQQQRSRVAQATERRDRLGRRRLRGGAEHTLRERELLEPQPALA
jgi:hypothetical protein